MPDDKEHDDTEDTCSWGSRAYDFREELGGSCWFFDHGKFFPKNRLQAVRGPVCDGRFSAGWACQEGGALGCKNGKPDPLRPPPCKHTAPLIRRDEPCAGGWIFSEGGGKFPSSLLRRVIQPEAQREAAPWEANIAQRGERLIERIHECLSWLAENEHVDGEEARKARENIRNFIDDLAFATEGGRESHLRNQVIRALETAADMHANGYSLDDACLEARGMIRHIDNELGEKLRPQRDKAFGEEDTPLSRQLRERQEAFNKELSRKRAAMQKEGKSEQEQLEFSREERNRFHKEQRAIKEAEEPHEGLLREAVKAWAGHLKSPGAKEPQWKATRDFLVFLFGEDVPENLSRLWRKWLEKRPQVPRPGDRL